MKITSSKLLGSPFWQAIACMHGRERPKWQRLRTNASKLLGVVFVLVAVVWLGLKVRLQWLAMMVGMGEWWWRRVVECRGGCGV